MRKQSVQLAVRFDAALVKEIEAERRRLMKREDGARGQITLSETVRYLVRKGLKNVEKN